MSGVSKITAERNHRLLLELLSKPGNDICADCKARNPRWASYNLGVFICVNCASIHRKMGTHISKVRSLTLDSWTKEQVESMKAMGNLKSNAIHNPNETRYPPPPAMADPENDPELESYIRSKYQYKQFMDKSAYAALKFGSSRTAPNAASRPISTPVVKPKPPAAAPLPLSNSVPPAGKPPIQKTAPQQLPPAVATSSPPFTSQLVPQTQLQRGGVWTDLISLQEAPRSSSLPLQYQVPAAVAPTGVGLGVTNHTFAHTVPATSPLVMSSYQTSFSQAPPTPGLSTPAAFVSSAPFSAGFVTPMVPHVQQQYLQPQPLSAGSTFAMPQQYTSTSPALLSTPSPALAPFATPSPQLPTQSPGVGYMQSTVTVMRPAVGLTGAPQMHISMPPQQLMATGYMPAMQAQTPMGYASGVPVNFQAQGRFGNTAQHQWGPL